MNYYSVSEFIKTVFSFTITKITFNKARLIRRPIYVRGRKSLVGGIGLTTGYSCRFDMSGKGNTLFIGDNCEFGDMTHIVAYERVEIGNNVLIASKCFISDTSHGCYKGERQSSPAVTPRKRELVTSPTKIGNNVWIGENVVILAGAKIGDGCIIGANSVITKKVPDNSIVVGNPMRIIKQWDSFENEWIERA